MAGGARRYDIKAADIESTPPPNDVVTLNKENTGVCDIVVDPRSQMCGMVLPDGPFMRRHIRQDHYGDRLDRRRLIMLYYFFHLYFLISYGPLVCLLKYFPAS